MFKKVLVHTRRGIKFTILFMLAAFLIIGAIAFLYKPTYSVFIEGKQIGYTEDRTGFFIHELKRAADAVIYKMQELQMRI